MRIQDVYLQQQDGQQLRKPVTVRQQVENGSVDFVVTQDIKLEDCNLNACPYTLVDSADMYLEGDTYTYHLYQKID